MSTNINNKKPSSYWYVETNNLKIDIKDSVINYQSQQFIKRNRKGVIKERKKMIKNLPIKIQDANRETLLDIQRTLCSNVSKKKLYELKKELDSINYNDLHINDVSLRFDLFHQINRRLSL